MKETPVVFSVGGEALLGLVHEPRQPSRIGVMILVGGPQYRVGSHRQFVLLARRFAAAGIPAFRFDYRGMGDASGDQRDFSAIDADVSAALDAFQARVPGMDRVVVWGLCDAASAALIHAWRDARIAGLVLVNPWVRTEAGLARTYLRHYYFQRLLSPDFWRGLMRGRLRVTESLRSLLRQVRTVTNAGGRRPAAAGSAPADAGLPLPERMAVGWKRYRGPRLVLLSGNDLTAQEFRDTAGSSPAWRGLLDEPLVSLQELPEANHTFSRREWREQMAAWTLSWIAREFEIPLSGSADGGAE